MKSLCHGARDSTTPEGVVEAVLDPRRHSFPALPLG